MQVKLPDRYKYGGNWVNFFSNWMLQAHKHKTNTLGFAVNSLDPKVPPVTIDPLFMPYFNTFQTNEYRGDTDGTVVEGIAGGGNNCLLYLQITGS